MSGLSRARTELFQLLVLPSLAPDPVHANRQSPRHGDLGDFPSPPHRQVEVLVTPFLVAAHRNLSRFLERSPSLSATACSWFMIASAPGPFGDDATAVAADLDSPSSVPRFAESDLRASMAESAAHSGDPSAACALALCQSRRHPRSTAQTAVPRVVMPTRLHPHAHPQSLRPEIAI